MEVHDRPQPIRCKICNEKRFWILWHKKIDGAGLSHMYIEYRCKRCTDNKRQVVIYMGRQMSRLAAKVMQNEANRTR